MSEQDDGDELQTWPDHARLIEVTLDEASIGRNNAEVEHEREVAIFDLLEKNRFALEAHDAGPYTLRLSLADNRLVFTVADEAREPIQHVMLSLSPFRRIVKDYFLICDFILRGDQDPARRQDRGDRHGAARPARRRQPPVAGAAQGQDQRRYRHRAAPVHAALRAALEGLRLGRAPPPLPWGRGRRALARGG